MATSDTSSSRPIIAAWDGSEQARDAIALAGTLARVLETIVQIVHIGPIYVGYAEFAPAVQLEGARLLDEAPVELLGDVEWDKALVSGRSPAEGLNRAIEELDAELVVIGSTHHGPVGRVIPGTVADHLLHGSPCAVAIAPRGYSEAEDRSVRVIAVAYDGSGESRAAVQRACDIAMHEHAAIRVISVATLASVGWGAPGAAYSLPETLDDRKVLFREQLESLLAELPGEARAEGRLLSGRAAPQIVDECEKGVDLLVMGSRGYGAIGRVMLGSVSSEVIRTAPCPVLVVPPSAAHSDGRPSATSGSEAAV